MTSIRPPHTVDAIYAIGRNVVNFQRLEQMLKLVVQMVPISSPLETFTTTIEKQKTKCERLTLGGAVRKWIETSDPANKQLPESQPDDPIMIHLGIDVSWKEGSFERLSRELESLAQERNRLIHLDLAQIDFDNEVECTKLKHLLDAQNARIEKARRTIEPILKNLANFGEWLNSDEGKQAFVNALLSNEETNPCPDGASPQNDSSHDTFTITEFEKDDPGSDPYLAPPTEEDQPTFVANIQLLPGSDELEIEELGGSLAWSSSNLTIDDFNALKALGLRGKLLASGCHGDGDEHSRALIVAQERIKEPIDLQQPNNCYVIYYQDGDEWKKFPIDAPVLKKRIRLTVPHDEKGLFDIWVEADLYSGAGGGGGLFDWRNWPGVS